MSLLVSQVQARCDHKLELTQFDADNRVKAAEQRAQHVEAEAQAAVAHYEALTKEAEKKAGLRIQQALDEVEVVEARAKRDRQAAIEAKRRADAMVEEERAAAAVKVAQLEQKVEDIQKQADLHIAELNQKLEAERKRAEEVERDCKDRVAKFQADADARIKAVESRVPQAIESARSQCKAQVADIAGQAERGRQETQTRLLEAQKVAQERIALQTKHSTESRNVSARVVAESHEHEKQFHQVALEREATAKVIEERAYARAAETVARNEEQCQLRFEQAHQHTQQAEKIHEESRGLVREAAADCWRQGIPVAANGLLSKGNFISTATSIISSPARPKYHAEDAPTDGTPAVFPHRNF
jgi:hypothetical protein